MSRCFDSTTPGWDTSWSTPWRVYSPSAGSRDQSIRFGRTSVAADRGDNVLHVTWIEGNTAILTPDEPTGPLAPSQADVWWGAFSYDDCA